MKPLVEVLRMGTERPGQAGPEVLAVPREAPPAPPDDTFEDEQQADLFIYAHHARFAKQGMPHPMSPEGREEYGHWLTRFIARGLRPSEALVASERIKEMLGVFPGDHLPLILRIGASLRREREEREAAQARAAAAALAAADDSPRLARWAALPEQERRAIRTAVLTAHPGIGRWDAVVLGYCLDALESNPREDR